MILGNLMLLSEIADEVVEETENTFAVLTFTPAQIKLIILTILVVGFAIYFILRPTPEKTKTAQDFLSKLSTQIMAIIIANIEYRVDGFDGTIELSFDDFKKKLIDTIYEEAWSFVETTLKKAVEDKKLDGLTAKYIKKESVESLVNLVLSRDNIQIKFKDAFDNMITKFNEQVEKENAEAEKFAQECENQPEEDGDLADTSEVEIFTQSIPVESEVDEDQFIEIIE